VGSRTPHHRGRWPPDALCGLSLAPLAGGLPECPDPGRGTAGTRRSRLVSPAAACPDRLADAGDRCGRCRRAGDPGSATGCGIHPTGGDRVAVPGSGNPHRSGADLPYPAAGGLSAGGGGPEPGTGLPGPGADQGWRGVSGVGGGSGRPWGCRTGQLCPWPAAGLVGGAGRADAAVEQWHV
jgi:hypothetical protein